MKDIETLEIQTQEAPQIVKPLVSAEQAKSLWEEYEKFKQAVVKPSDIQRIQGQDFLKKSYWRKLERFFGIKLQLLKEEEKFMQVLLKRKKKKTPQGVKVIYEVAGYYPMDFKLNPRPDEEVKITIVFSATYRATAPTGQFCDGDGHCDLWEKGYCNTYHNAKATAHTRAKNRAISDLVGGGEVSAEEVLGEYEAESMEETEVEEMSATEPTQAQKKKIFAMMKEKGFTKKEEMVDFWNWVMNGVEDKKARASELIEKMDEFIDQYIQSKKGEVKENDQ